MSVGENIAYGLPDDVVSKEDVIKAAKAANAHEFIISLPQVMKQSTQIRVHLSHLSVSFG